MEKTAPCMAIAEKKGHRTSGCMNVFFQFFEWNRKFSKKSLFSKKLLLRAAGEELASKRFGKKEKMQKPVIHLITDGYTGSFPSVKKKKKKKYDDSNNDEDDNHCNEEPQHDTRSPGLVARLMGLESMPAFAGQNQKSDEPASREDKPPDDPRFANNVDPEPESALQKPLKEMVSDRRSMARFGAEGLHLKDVLSRPRNHNHHLKLPSQLKSPKGNTRNHNSSRTSRLMDVATRILEPGLQAKNRAKYTLTDSHASHMSRGRLKANKTAVVPPVSEKGSLIGKRLLGEQSVECPTSASRFVSVSSLHSPEKNEKKPVSTFIQNVERNRIRTQDQVSNSVRMRTIEGALGSSDPQSRRVSPPSSAGALSEAKDLTALNWTLSGKTGRTRHPSRTSRPEFGLETRFCTRDNDSLLSSRYPAKRERNEGRNSQFVNSGSVVSQLKKNGTVKRVTACEEEPDRKLSPRNRQPSRRNKNVETSSSVSGDRTKETSKVLDEKGKKLYIGKQMALSGDALGALLDRTLKELTCEDEEEMNGAGKARRSTAVILQDLISALTTEQLVTRNDPKPSTEITFQTEAENEESSLGCAHGGDDCRSSSIVEVSCSCFEADTTRRKAEAQDSANSTKNSNFPKYGTVTDLTDRISHMLIKMKEAGIRLKGGQLTHAQDVIENTELLLSDSTGSVAGSSLLDQLVVLGSRNWRPADLLTGFEEIEETDQFNRAFFFDSVIECLDSKYSMCGYSGIKPWRKSPSHINVESLFREETGRWTKLAGKSADEIIEWEMMNCSFGKWSDFNAEEFEIAVETSSDILQGLLEEFVVDLWTSR